MSDPVCSIYTPTNDARWLSEAYQSLCAQIQAPEWEWVILPNGRVADGVDVREALGAGVSDPRVRILAEEALYAGVGALKRQAVSQCRGSLLVELDHDDKLAPDCLARVHEASLLTPDGFYYSDFVSQFLDGRSEIYNSACGWQGYDWQYAGQALVAMRAFPAMASTLHRIPYAPNHVRVWSRAAYERAGGYDSAMVVGDDHDLLCRTYLAGVPFHHIPHCLYIYCSRLGSTCRVMNPNVMWQQEMNGQRYLHPLIYEECRRNDSVRAVWGDNGHSPPIDKLMPLEPNAVGRFALADNSVGCLWVVDRLHLLTSAQIARAFNEFYRVLCPGGWLLLRVPAVVDGEGKLGVSAFTNLATRSYWSLQTLNCVIQRSAADKWNEVLKIDDQYTGRFQLARQSLGYASETHKYNRAPQLEASLIALKGQRGPDRYLI